MQPADMKIRISIHFNIRYAKIKIIFQKNQFDF